MNRKWHRFVPTVIAVAAAASLTTMTAGSASALTATIDSSLNDVSCPSATDCMAVGWSEETKQSSLYYTLGEQWNGKSWAIVPTPSPIVKGGGGFLNAVSCASSTFCVAVGDTLTVGFASTQLAEMWNGTRWSLVTLPKLSAEAASLNGVSCTSATSCFAVGNRGTNKNPTQLTLAESWNGKTWAVDAMPATPSGGTALKGVSCLSFTNCMAVGYDAGNSVTEVSKSLAEHWNGHDWAILSTPAPGGSAVFGGVSCPSASDCVAVGTHVTTTSIGVTFAAVWNGSAWTAQSIPEPANTSGAGLGSVSCNSATACMAGGSWTDPMGETTGTLAESWNGHDWAILSSPSPRYNNEMNGIACVSAPDCQSVGDSQNESGNGVTLGEAWNGSVWSLIKTPNP